MAVPYGVETQEPRRKRRSTAPRQQDFLDMTPEQQEETFSLIHDFALPGVAMVGNVIDLPGSSVRDVIAGENPADQWLPWNWTTSDHRVTGRELLRDNDLIGEEDTWENFGGGLATEILLDPLTYPTLGLAGVAKSAIKGVGTRAGKVASAGVHALEGAPIVGKQLKKMRPDRSAMLPEGPGRFNADVKIKAEPFKGHDAGRIVASDAGKDVGYVELNTQTPIQEDLLRDTIFKDIIKPDEPLARMGTVGIWDEAAKGKGIGRRMYLEALNKNDGWIWNNQISDAAKKTVDDLAEAGLIKVHWGAEKSPWSGYRAMRITKRGKNALRKGVDDAGHPLIYGPLQGIKNLANAAFDTPSMGALNPEVQRINRESYRAMEEAGKKVAETVNSLKSKWGKSGIKKDDWADIRSTLENPEFNVNFKPEWLPENIRPLYGDLIEIRQSLDDLVKREQAAGIKVDNLSDVSSYFPRQASKIPQRLRKSSIFQRLFGTGHPSQIQRQGMLRGFDDSTRVINEITSDPAIVGMKQSGDLSKADIRKYLEDNYGERLRSATKEGRAGAGDLPEGFSDKDMGHLADWVGNMDREYVEMGGFFSNNPLDDFAGRLRMGEKALANIENMQKHIADLVEPDPIPGDVQVSKLLKDSGLTDKAHTRMKELLGTDNLDDVYVPQSVYKDMKRTVRTLTNQDQMDGVMNALHRWTQAFKKGVTTPFPAFHVRNFNSGQFQNYLMGLYDDGGIAGVAGGVVGMTKGLSNARRMLKGETIEGASKFPVFDGMDLTDAEATTRIQQLILENELIGPGQQIMDYATESPTAQFLQDSIAGLDPTPQTYKQWFSEYRKTLGENAGDTVEYYNRAAPFIDQLRRGVDPTDAAKKVKIAQVDYSDLTDFERQYMRLAFPFYSFQKGITRAVVGELYNNPGGRLGQTVRAQRHLAEQSEEDIEQGRMLPEYMTRGAFIPMGELEDGTYRAMSGLGLMHEPVFEMAGAPMAEATGMANPLVTYPFEAATGRSFFRDQPLNQLDPAVGRTMSNLYDLATGSETQYPEPFLGDATRAIGAGPMAAEHLISSSPISRYVSTARTLTDPRKYEPVEIAGVPVPPALMNTLTGFNVYDASPQAQEYAAENITNEVLQQRGGRVGEYTYVPKEKQLDEQTNSLVNYQRMIKSLHSQARRNREE